eukprot:COSAG04_NODE_133_length_23964_cov_7.547999_2_plen_212_part_00
MGAQHSRGRVGAGLGPALCSGAAFLATTLPTTAAICDCAVPPGDIDDPRAMLAVGGVAVGFGLKTLASELTRKYGLKEREYDFYIIHRQASGQDQCKALAMLLEQAGAKVWYDMQASDLTDQGMEKGLANSKNALIFLSDGVMDSDWCQVRCPASSSAFAQAHVLMKARLLRRRCAGRGSSVAVSSASRKTTAATAPLTWTTSRGSAPQRT